MVKPKDMEFVKYMVCVDGEEQQAAAGHKWEAIDAFGAECRKLRAATKENPHNETKLIELFIFRPNFNDWFRMAGEFL